MRNVYVSTDFEGHWPVGTAAVVVAATEHSARVFLRDAIIAAGLPDKPFTLRQIDTTQSHAVILRDGDY